MIYDIQGNSYNSVYLLDGTQSSNAYDIDGNNLLSNIPGDDPGDPISFDDMQRVPQTVFTVDESQQAQTYMGGYIEIQPDSWDGSTPVTGDIVSPSDSTAWGFPTNLSSESKARIKAEMLNGQNGIMYIRFPLGFGYRGYRNIDSITGLAKNIGQRWEGQNSSLQDFFSDISRAGGGLAPEYWCPAPYWLTGGAYYNADVNNYLTAGGNYPRTTTLDSIRTSDPTQYANQIDDFTDAVVNDLEYLHQNIAPVRMFGLQGEPTGAKAKYGKMGYNSAQLYNDVLEVLYPKIQASTILSTWNNQPNTVLLHVASSNETPPFDGIASTFIENHASWIWGYSFDAYMTRINASTVSSGAVFYSEDAYATSVKGNRDNVFNNEYEYFSDTVEDDKRLPNNLLRMTMELQKGGAKVVLPIIHLCKPAGQSSYDTNTRGYCIFAVDMNDGSVDENTWAYRSWRMFNNNLPVGAQLISATSSGYNGLVITKVNNKLRIFMCCAYRNEKAGEFVLTFASSKRFKGKVYSMDYNGRAVQEKSGTTISFKCPGNGGIVWFEQ